LIFRALLQSFNDDFFFVLTAVPLAILDRPTGRNISAKGIAFGITNQKSQSSEGA